MKPSSVGEDGGLSTAARQREAHEEPIRQHEHQPKDDEDRPRPCLRQRSDRRGEGDEAEEADGYGPRAEPIRNDERDVYAPRCWLAVVIAPVQRRRPPQERSTAPLDTARRVAVSVTGFCRVAVERDDERELPLAF